MNKQYENGFIFLTKPHPSHAPKAEKNLTVSVLKARPASNSAEFKYDRSSNKIGQNG